MSNKRDILTEPFRKDLQKFILTEQFRKDLQKFINQYLQDNYEQDIIINELRNMADDLEF